jgi:hypothetical protein
VILLWGVRDERPLAKVEAELRNLSAPYYVVDQRRTHETNIQLDGSGNLDYLECCGRAISMTDVRSCYLRPYDIRDLPTVSGPGPNSAEWLRALALDESLLCWMEMTTATVVNRPSAMLSNGSKPFQLALIADAGFVVPETLVTNDASELENFLERHRQVVYKSISGMRSKVTRLSPQILAERKNDLVHCPTQFQEYVGGVDYRVHIVGERTFSCQIHSEQDDYRFQEDGSGVQIMPADLPCDVICRCVRLTASLGLLLSGIDLRQAQDDRWYCFEVNPSPAFTYYEQYTKQPIAGAIAQLLASI